MMEPDNQPPRHPTLIGDAQAPPRKPLFMRLEERIWGTGEEKEQGFTVFFKRWLQILDRGLIGFYKNKCFETASALTYTSILTLVPLLAIMLAVLKGFGVHQAAHDALKKVPFIQALKIQKVAEKNPDLPFQISLTEEQPTTSTAVSAATPPASSVQTTQTLASPPGPHSANGQTSSTTLLTGEQFADQVFTFVERTDISRLGLIGMLGLLWAVMGLLSRIEDAMNRAWAVHRSRSLARKLSDYLNMMVIVILFLAGVSVTITSKINDVTGFLNTLGIQGLGEFVIKMLPYMIVWPAFIFMYYYIPNTRVKLSSAVISGLVAGTMFQLLQTLFIRTQILVGRYNKIYGIFAILIILLVWAYFSWCIVLWGAEICSAHQNLRDWRRRRRSWLGTPAERETLTLRMAALLASPLLGKEGSKRMDAGDLADTLMLPLEPVGEIIDLFQANGLLIQSAEDGAYIFARSPESVSVLDLLRLVRQGSIEPQAGASGWLSKLSCQIQPTLALKTVKDLVDLPVDDIKTFIL